MRICVFAVLVCVTTTLSAQTYKVVNKTGEKITISYTHSAFLQMYDLTIPANESADTVDIPKGMCIDRVYIVTAQGRKSYIGGSFCPLLANAIVVGGKSSMCIYKKSSVYSVIAC